MAARSVKVEPVDTSIEKMSLTQYKEPDQNVMASLDGCSRRERQPTFEILFGSTGKVEAVRNLSNTVCAPLTRVWQDAIREWRIDPAGVGFDSPPPMLFRVTLRLGSHPKSSASPAKRR